MVVRLVIIAAVAAVSVAGCSSAESGDRITPPPASPSSATSAAVSPSPRPSPSHTATVKPVPSLQGDTRNAIAFAPLDNPRHVTVEGSVDSSPAWSTSKVLVIMAFIQEVAGGDPANLTVEQRDLIERALTESNMDALLAIRAQIPGGSGAPMTEILRSIGDDHTTAPDIREGLMEWSIRDQVKFMAALADGDVVSPEASRYVLKHMQPVKSESWGLGTIGASAFKGGWLEPYTVTRQMGIVDGYAVAIITDGVGPSELQIDDDYAHVKQMNKLAKILKAHLDAENAASEGATN
ncbi:MAG: hypothetical protein U0R64_00035 [Candidatus Nanopelagicales bacterium]